MDQSHASTPAAPNGTYRSGEGERPVVTVAIDSLNPADSPRLGGVNVEHARVLAEAEDALPPILVSRATMRVIDGMHRLHAARLNGQDEVEVELFEGSEREAFLVAVKTNTTHGLPLTLAERRAAAKRIMVENPQLSDRVVAATTGLAAKTVAVVRRRATEELPQSNIRIGRDGRVRPLDSTAGRRLAGKVIAADPGASLRTIAERSGISIGTARDVRRRVLTGEDPVPHGRRGARTANRGHTRSLVKPQAVTEDPRRLLEGLRRDPSLRYTEVGRSLLRWLELRTVATAEWQGDITKVPPHCSIILSRIAHACAAAWLDLAEELGQTGGGTAGDLM